MHAMILAAGTSDWSFGASILTFALPMILFVAVAGGLFVLYTTPHVVPGHRYRREQLSASVFAHAPVQAPSGDGHPADPSATSTAAGSEDPAGPDGQ